MTDKKKCQCGDCCECLSTIPDGGTCAGCVHVGRCTTIFGQKATDTACQFVPSRYRPLPVVGAGS